MKVIIMSSIPGGGKSTWVKKNYPDAIVLSTDNEHVDADGVYRFKADRLAEFHNKTLERFSTIVISHPSQQPEVLVIDNTGIKLWELAPYYRLAEAFGHDVRIVRIHCDPEVAIKRGLHGVPPEKVREMAQSFDSLPPWWKVQHIFNS